MGGINPTAWWNSNIVVTKITEIIHCRPMIETIVIEFFGAMKMSKNIKGFQSNCLNKNIKILIILTYRQDNFPSYRDRLVTCVDFHH